MTQPVAYNSPDRIIRQAMINCGKLSEGADPSPFQYQTYTNQLNDMINLWCTRGMKLWLWLDKAITLVAGQNKYTLGPSGNVVMTKPLQVLMAYYLDVNNNQRPLAPPLSWDDWTRLSNLVQQGAVNSYFVDKQQSSLNVGLWLTPDAVAATGTVHLVIRQQVTNVVGLGDVLNFPQEWFIALHWGLAKEICTGQPASIIDRCTKMANEYRDDLEAWDIEDASTTFTPDMRTGYGTSSFV